MHTSDGNADGVVRIPAKSLHGAGERDLSLQTLLQPLSAKINAARETSCTLLPLMAGQGWAVA